MKRFKPTWERFNTLQRKGYAFDARTQRPFPGSYPTRMWILVKRGPVEVFRYFGKPSLTQLRAAINRGEELPERCIMILGEVDKGGFLGLSNFYLARGANIDPFQHPWLNQNNAHLVFAYHPFTTAAGNFSWLRTQQFVKRSKETKLVRYSPNKTDKLASVKEYKLKCISLGVHGPTKTS